MSLKPQSIGPIPELTAYVARAAFPEGNPYVSLRDTPGTFYVDERFAALFPDRGQPAETPWRLALVTVLQFAEGLADRQAADAVRGRIDRKHALGLELTDPGFDFSVPCEFRARLVSGGAGRLLLEAMLQTCKAHDPVKARSGQRIDSTHPRPGRHPDAQPPGTGRRDAPRRAERPGDRGLAVAAVVGPARVVRSTITARGGSGHRRRPRA